MSKNNNGIAVHTNEKNQINIDSTLAIDEGLDATVVELLNQLYIEDKPLYIEVINLVSIKENQIDLESFLILVQTVFAKYAFRLDFEQEKWLEIKESITRLKNKHISFNKIIVAYVKSVKLDAINPALPQEEISKVNKEIETYFMA